jgi:hypothetical protein
MVLDWCAALSKRQYSDSQMGLPELRRLCIRRQLSVSFTLPDATECSINEHGATVINGQAGSLAASQGFEGATGFRIMTKGSGRWRPISRNALERLALELTGAGRPKLPQRHM